MDMNKKCDCGLEGYRCDHKRLMGGRYTPDGDYKKIDT